MSIYFCSAFYDRHERRTTLAIPDFCDIVMNLSSPQEEPCGVGFQEERVDGECQDINECLTGKW